jgi:hypothetical protein
VSRGCLRRSIVGVVLVSASALVPPAVPREVAAKAGGAQAAAAQTIFIDASVTDDLGHAVTSLRPEDLRVTVDGEPRSIVSLRYVYRGPGADASAAIVDRAANAPPAAERSRLLLLLADENAIFRGQQKQVAAVVGRMVDELGVADQAAVAMLPRPSAELALTTSPNGRPAIVARIQGRAVNNAQAITQTMPQAVADANSEIGGATGVAAEDLARIELDRQTARERRGAQEDLSATGPDEMTASASLRALRGLIDAVAPMPGLKSFVVFRQGEWVNDGQAADIPADLTSAVLASAARSRVVVHVVTVGAAARRRSGRDEMAAIAASTGGTLTTAKNAGDAKSFDGIHAALWGGYLVEVEGRETDSGSRPHTVKIDTARAKTVVRAPALWMSRSDPVPPVVPVPTPAASSSPSPGESPSAATPSGSAPAVRVRIAPPRGSAAAAEADARPTRRTPTDDPQLTLLLARMSEFIAAYVQEFGNVVAEEDYVQRLIRGGSNQVHLKSDILLVMTNAEVGWTQYRDVFDVDGRSVRDREARVQKLFLENPTAAPRLALEISNESARYNVGTLFRNINTPTLPLEYLSPKRIGGLAFWRDGEETVDGIRAVRLAFEETARPTMVQPDVGPRADIPARGTYWVDASSGRILRTRILLTAGRAEMSTTVSYKSAQNIGLWVPAEMHEKYTTTTEEIEGRATYKNFRSFSVTTEAKVKDEPKAKDDAPIKK